MILPAHVLELMNLTFMNAISAARTSYFSDFGGRAVFPVRRCELLWRRRHVRSCSERPPVSVRIDKYFYDQAFLSQICGIDNFG